MYMAGHITNLATKFEHPMPIRSWFMFHWKCVHSHCSCAESRDPWLGGQKQLHFWNPRPRFAYSLYNFYWVTTMIKGRLLLSRSMLKSFSGHLAAILFYANYKVKTQNSAWEPCSSHSACLSYVKKSGSPLLPPNAPNSHNSEKCFKSILPSVLWRCWLGGRKGIRPVKNWAVGCWRGYLSGARCRLAYGPADFTATHCFLLQ